MAVGAQVVALLRGVNVSGKNKIKMADLRDLALEAGLALPRTYIQSGNLIFVAKGEPGKLELLLEGAIADRFQLQVPVVVRTEARWRQLEHENPFPEFDPKFVHYAAAKNPPAADATDRLLPYAKGGEQIAAVADGLWIHYASGAGKSKITPSVLDRCVGSSVTARNLKTVRAVAAMLEACAAPAPAAERIDQTSGRRVK